ncbi:MAG: DUF6077 domain-containing protein, partial [Nocardioidaceae bacterium]
GLELATLMGTIAVRTRTDLSRDDVDRVAAGSTDGARSATRLTIVTASVAAATAVAMAISMPWTVIWIGWLVAAVIGTRVAFQQLPREAADGSHPAAPASTPPEWDARAGADSPSDPWSSAAVVVWGLGLAAMSMFTLRPNPDDLYYVNLSQWVAAHGTFPTRDTIFSDLVFPMSNWPPIASYDPLAGSIAHLAGVQAGSIVYVVVPPLATLLSVLALWRLLRAWRLQRVAVALSAALIFLLFDGGGTYATPGNLFLTRLWQGKIILLCLLVPMLLVYAIRYVQRPSLARAGWLFAAGVAAVGVSTTAMFLVPPIAAAGAAPLLRRARGRAFIGFAAMAAYPLVAGVVTTAMGGRSADDFAGRSLYRFDPQWFGHAIFLTGMLALVAVGAVLLGALLVPHLEARATTGLLALVTGLTFIPGVTHLSYDTVGLGPTLWRLSWAASIAALVGVLAAWLAERLHGRWRVAVAGFVTLGLLTTFGSPIWAPDTNASWALPFHWQRGQGTRSVADQLIQESQPGDLVLAPDALAITLDVTTTDIKTVAPRDYFMDYLRDDPSFQYRQRIALVDFVNHDGPWNRRVVSRAVTALGVDAVCLDAVDGRRVRVLIDSGYKPVLGSSLYRCLRT